MQVEYYVYVTDVDEEMAEDLNIKAEKTWVYCKGYIDIEEVSNFWEGSNDNLNVWMRNGNNFTIKNNQEFRDAFDLTEDEKKYLENTLSMYQQLSDSNETTSEL